MTATELRQFWHRSPFVPFDVIVPGGEKFRVPHLDFLSVSPNGRIAHIWKENGEYAAVDVFLVSAVEENRRRTKRGS
jgi:hypothetical protein